MGYVVVATRRLTGGQIHFLTAGLKWTDEYPAAKEFTSKGEAVHAARYPNLTAPSRNVDACWVVKVVQDYGRESEREVELVREINGVLVSAEQLAFMRSLSSNALHGVHDALQQFVDNQVEGEPPPPAAKAVQEVLDGFDAYVAGVVR